MAWYIASVPLWAAGLFFFFAAVYGVVRIGRNPANCPEDAGLINGVTCCTAISVALLLLAAWVVS